MIDFPLIALSSFTLSFSESVLLLIGLVIVAIGVSIWVYRYTVPEVSSRLRITLIVFRSLALAVLLFILFQPVLNLEEDKVIEPKTAVLLDNSKSMTVQDAGTDRGEALRRLTASPAFSSLDGDAAGKYYLIGQTGYPLQSFHTDSLDFGFAETNLSEALQKAHDDMKEGNLRAVVLVSDGVFTSGKNPLYTAEALGVPVYTVGVGDSTEKKDVLIGSVMASAIAYVDNAVPVELTVRSAGYDAGSVTVTLTEGGNRIGTQQVQLRPGANEYPVEFEYIPKTEGTRKLTVSVSPLPGELTTKNNQRSFFVKVLKTKMQVAVLAGAPSGDVAVLRQALAEDKNIEATFYVQKSAQAFYGDAPTAKALAASDCIILAGFPIAQSPGTAMQAVQAAVSERNKPLFIILSRTTDVQRLESALGAAMPVQTLQVRGNENEVFVRPSEGAAGNPVLSTGISKEAWRQLPPLFKTESSFKPKVGAEVLATMEINTVLFNEPVLVARKVNRQRVLLSTVYGLHRWQLAWDVLDGNVPSLLISNAVRWLTTHDDEKQVRIAPVKEFFDSAEPVEFQGQVYDESYEPVSAAAVTVTIQTGGGDRDLVLNPLGNGFYRGSIEQLGEGDYTYSGKAEMDGTQIGTDRGRFSVGEQNIEFVDTRMNSALLRQIAARTGGAYFDASDADGLTDALLNNPDFQPQINVIKSDIQLWNLLYLLGLAVLFFAIEWFLRKQSGMV